MFLPSRNRCTHPFRDYMQYLNDSHALVEKSYQLEKQRGFDGEGTAESRQFIRERLAAGATMLRNMWYSAWLESAEDPDAKGALKPVPATNTQDH